MNNKVCSFFGHRKIEITKELKQKVKEVIEDLIVNHNVLTFLFGSRSEFDSLCHEVVTKLKEKFVKKLEKQSLERQNNLDEFKFLKERIAWLKDRQNKKDWVLNYDERKQELKKSEDFIDSIEKREEEFAKQNYKKEEILLEASKEAESKKKEAKKEAKSEKKKDLDADLFDEDEEEIFDVQLREALRVMADWIEVLQRK